MRHTPTRTYGQLVTDGLLHGVANASRRVASPVDVRDPRSKSLHASDTFRASLLDPADGGAYCTRLPEPYYYDVLRKHLDILCKGCAPPTSGSHRFRTCGADRDEQRPGGGGIRRPRVAREICHSKAPAPGHRRVLGANAHGEMGWFGSHSLDLTDTPEQPKAWGATITFGYAVMHMVFHGLPSQRMRLRGPAVRSLRRIWTPSQCATATPEARDAPT